MIYNYIIINIIIILTIFIVLYYINNFYFIRNQSKQHKSFDKSFIGFLLFLGLLLILIVNSINKLMIW